MRCSLGFSSASPASLAWPAVVGGVIFQAVSGATDTMRCPVRRPVEWAELNWMVGGQARGMRCGAGRKERTEDAQKIN